MLEYKNELLTKIYNVAPLDADADPGRTAAPRRSLRPYVDDTALRVAYAAKSRQESAV